MWCGSLAAGQEAALWPHFQEATRWCVPPALWALMHTWKFLSQKPRFYKEGKRNHVNAELSVSKDPGRRRQRVGARTVQGRRQGCMAGQAVGEAGPEHWSPVGRAGRESVRRKLVGAA